MAGVRQGVDQAKPDKTVTACNRDFQRINPSIWFDRSYIPSKVNMLAGSLQVRTPERLNIDFHLINI